MRHAAWAMLFFAACGPSADSTPDLDTAATVANTSGGVESPVGPAITIVDPEFVVLRSVRPDAQPELASAVVDHGTYYFNPADRILDLRGLDPRTAAADSSAEGTYIVLVQTTPEGARLLGTWTAANVDRHLGVFVGGRLISAPLVKSRLDSMIVLDGGFTRSEAQAIVARLKRGGAAV